MGYLGFFLFRYKAVWLIFFVLGLGTLLPWNFFMTATQVRLGAGRHWVPEDVSPRLSRPVSAPLGTERNRGSNAQPLKTPQYFTNRLDLSQNMSTVTDKSSQDTETLPAPTVSAPERSSLSTIFNNVMTLCAMLPLLLFACLNSFLHQR